MVSNKAMDFSHDKSLYNTSYHGIKLYEEMDSCNNRTGDSSDICADMYLL
jgi:hypothetical protein